MLQSVELADLARQVLQLVALHLRRRPVSVRIRKSRTHFERLQFLELADLARQVLQLVAPKLIEIGETDETSRTKH